MTKPLSVIFDLDGTLVDSAPDLAATANVLLERRGRRQVSLDELRRMVGKGAIVMMDKALAATGVPATQDELKGMLPEFLEHYGAHIADHTVPFPGLLPALDELAGRGCSLGVCTNKFEELSNKLLSELDMAHYFQAVLGGDSLPVRKPDPGHLLGTIERMGGDPARAIMVGDSSNDIDAARAAGIPSIAVTFGYTDVPAPRLGADRIVSHFDDLIGAIDDITG